MDRRNFFKAAGGAGIGALALGMSPNILFAQNSDPKQSYRANVFHDSVTYKWKNQKVCYIRTRLTNLKNLSGDTPFILSISNDINMNDIIFKQPLFSSPAQSYVNEVKAVLPGSGPLYARITLMDQTNIRSKVWTIKRLGSQ
jgi:hypothetical protein